jgi:serine protease Do
VVPGGPAATAGLRVGDIVATLDERPMENARQLEVNLYRRSVGETVSLVVRRQSKNETLSVQVVERLEDPERFVAMVTPERNLIPRLGILGIELDPDVLKLLPELRGNDGVVVAARVGSFGPEDLQPGDVIHAVNGISVQGLAELRSATAALKKMDAVVLQIERAGRLQYLAFEMSP